MNNFIELTKVFFLSGFNVNKRKKNQKSAFQLLFGFGILFLAMSTFYNYTYMNLAIESGLALSNYMVIVLQIDAMIVLMTTLFSMQGAIFKSKDYEFLESLPIKKETIVLAKIAAIYLIGLFEDLLISVPAIIFYIVFTSDVYFAIVCLISTLFVSIIPLLVSSLLGSLIAYVTSKMKNQNVVSIVLYLLMFSVIFGISFASSMSSSGFDVLSGGVLYFKLIEYSVDPHQSYNFIIFIIIHLVALLLVVLFISKIYRPINAYLGNIKNHQEYISGKYKGNLTVDKALYKKELNMVLKNAKYAVNSFLGGFMYLFMGGFFIVLTKSITSDPSIPIDEVDSIMFIFPAIAIATGIMMNSIMSSTSASISLEANNFQLLASYPISVNDIVKNKLKVGVIIPLILNTFSGIVLAVLCCFICVFDIQNVIGLILLPSLQSILTAIIGMICGLRWPKFEFENEMQVMKNSAAVSLSMLFSFLAAIIPMGLIIVLKIFFATSIVPIIVCAIYYAIVIGLAYLILKKNQDRLFTRDLTI